MLFPTALNAALAIQLSIPLTPPTQNFVVSSNFLGLSVELSYVDRYFGNNASSVPEPMVNYLSSLRRRTGASPLRVRIGGNSMDGSTYVPAQTQPLIAFTKDTSFNEQNVTYGPALWEVLNSMASSVGGTQYIIGLSLRNPNDTGVPIMASAAKNALGTALDAYLLGNEPDLYTRHGDRPNVKNFTVPLYLDDFATATRGLQAASGGNLLNQASLGGPSLCCTWDLATVLQQGFLDKFDAQLKYIALQHYAQSNCFGPNRVQGVHEFELPVYLNHSKTQQLGTWQKHGIDLLHSSNSPTTPKLIMGEFNTAGCGGVPGISDTFGAGTLYIADYALQLASVGYSAAFLHTREPGISYNVVDPPADPTSSWATNPGYYAMLAVTEALNAPNGSKVQDLDTGSDANAAYAIYDANAGAVNRIALFNFANSSGSTTSFSLPLTAASLQKDKTVGARFLVSSSVNEKVNIAWGGKTFAGASDGKSVSASWAKPDLLDLKCSDGCTVDVPGPGMAVVFLDGIRTYSDNASKHPLVSSCLFVSATACVTVLYVL